MTEGIERNLLGVESGVGDGFGVDMGGVSSVSDQALSIITELQRKRQFMAKDCHNLAHGKLYGKVFLQCIKTMLRGVEQMSLTTDVTRAAQNVLTKSLQLRQHQNLLIFADAGSIDVADLMAETARHNGVGATVFYVPVVTQTKFSFQESLPLPIEAAIRETDAVLNVLNGLPETLAYRRRVLQTSWGRRVKVAHCPGMTLDMLRLVDVDFDFIRTRCNLLATALALGKRVEIRTKEHHGNKHLLEIEIGGWEFPPGIGDGLIPEGAWANLPPGETFTIPQEANGSIVINGSLPGRVLQPGEELILTFRHGRLTQIWPEDGDAVDHLRHTQVREAERHDDPNWSNLAEIGFGVNPVVEHLTGTPAVDEKKHGTIHVALGDSHSLGGLVSSTIHCDLVVQRPTVQVDGITILDEGQWRADAAAIVPDYRTTTAATAWWAGVRAIKRSGVRVERVNDHLVRYWNSGPGRFDYLPVGTPQTAQVAAHLYKVLPVQQEPLSREQLLAAASQIDLSEEATANLLWVMCRYDLVRVMTE